MGDIDILLQEIKDRRTRVKKLLQNKWPRGTKIGCMLRYGQKTLSEMEVLDHNGDGYVTCGMLSSKPRSGWFVRDIYFKNICDLYSN